MLEVRTTGSDSNGGGFNAARSGSDYSQQDSPVATGTVTSATTTVTATTAIFTSVMVGNYITDGTTWKEITAFTSTTVVTVDSAPAWTAATINVGGALASPAKAIALMTAVGNIAWIKSGTYTISAGITFPSNGSTGFTAVSKVEGYTTTRGDRSTKPVIQATAAITMFTTTSPCGFWLINLDIDGNSTANNGISLPNTAYGGVSECKIRRMLNYGIKSTLSNISIMRNEVTTCGGATDGAAIFGSTSDNIAYNYVHDNTTTGIKCGNSAVVVSNIVANNTGASSDGIQFGYIAYVCNNVCYGNGRDGIRTTFNYPSIIFCSNNILVSNAGYGLFMTGAPGSPTSSPAVNFNAFYSNTTANRNNIPIGANDVILTVNPFTASGSNDFSLNNTAGGGAACRAAGFPGVFPGGLTTGYLDIGAAQHADPAASGGIMLANDFSGGYTG